MRQTCINCQHADYRTAAAEGMPKFSKCRRARNETEVAKFYGRDVECDNGAFAAANVVIVDKRLEWLSR